jgi:hypothetical protein
VYTFILYPFARISSEGKFYYVCTEGYSRYKTFFIIPDQPNFSPVNSDAEVKPQQFFKIGDLVFRYIGYTQNEGEEIDFDRYFKHRFMKVEFNADYTRKADDLYAAYDFIDTNSLTAVCIPVRANCRVGYFKVSITIYK